MDGVSTLPDIFHFGIHFRLQYLTDDKNVIEKMPVKDKVGPLRTRNMLKNMRTN